MTIAEVLRKGIRDSGLTIADIARLADVARTNVTRLMNEPANGLSIATADKLAKYFKLELQPLMPPTKTSKAPPAFIPPKRKPARK